ncbi:MAG: 1,4-dihydroxy-6-naphtoate synthase [Pseudomonadota bacterium]|jgi:1,4-dihydroxy-6-naphthoate synthase
MVYSLAISTCPNDTFMFHAILEHRIDLRGLEFEITLCDIQELNLGMQGERYDFCKASSVAALRAVESYELCPSGAALGYGVGPLLLKRKDAPPLGRRARVLCPGESTTANALFRHFYPDAGEVSQVVFSDIMPALRDGRADYGVVIHEGRFTYQTFGLEYVADLGTCWEERYQMPLPLGCVVAHRRLPPEIRQLFAEVTRASVEYAYANRPETLITMRRYAQELDDTALWAHVELYVNEWSVDLGDVGREAFERLSEVLC